MPVRLDGTARDEEPTPDLRVVVSLDQKIEYLALPTSKICFQRASSRHDLKLELDRLDRQCRREVANSVGGVPHGFHDLIRMIVLECEPDGAGAQHLRDDARLLDD